MALSRDTKVFVVVFDDNGNPHWLVRPDTKRDDRSGRIILWPVWGKPQEAKSLSLEYADVLRRRYKEEHGRPTHFTLQAGSTEYVEEPNSTNAAGEDTRQMMQYRGLLVHPGIDTKTGTRCWFVKTHDGPMQLESVRGATPEEAVDRAYERNLQHKAEKYIPPPQEAVEPRPVAPAGPRLRPGSLR